MTWADLATLAQERLAAGDGLEFEAWRSVMTTFRSVAGDDPAVGQVVDLAAGAARVQGSRPRSSDPLIEGAEHAAALGPGPGVQDAALQITHLALRSVVRVEEERVLATAELELTPSREVSDLAATLQGWRRALAACGAAGLTSSEMAAVAVNQVKLLKVTRTWCTQVSSPEGLRLGEVSSAVEDAYAAWATAVREWSTMLPRTAEVTPAQATLNRSWAAVLQAIRTEPSAARRMEALIASGMGGVLAAGLAVRAPGDTSSVLTAAGVAMELALDSWHGIHLRDVATREPTAQRRPLTSPIPRTIPKRAASRVLATEPQRGGVDVSKEELPPNRWESHRDAARAMTAGTIATAALGGDVTARQIAAGVHDRDLEELVERGERAKAALLVWAQPILVNALQGRFSKLTGPGRDELLQTMTVQLAETVHRWEPDKARFTTFVYRLAQFGPDRQARRFEERSRSEQPMGEQAESWQAETKTVEEQVLDAVSLTEIRRRIERLPAEQRDVLQRRFGLAGTPPITRHELAAERGVSPSTIRRVEDQALRALRDTTGQEVTRAVTSRSLSEQLTVAAASLHTKLTTQLRTNREANTQRPLIDRIQEIAATKRESQLVQWLKNQPSRERDGGLER
ncbi:MAG: sigma-70 family RNA polymerase sigma factor [Arachnia propionica]|uniref:sigma-70 family RNA polymerase sigma factor n=1 Tax=Arachnia propionica TaxID=1750 RepID=UPI00271005A0|nr:sigma-70 family RNA polymerase sigma factor [Arachnia propionica]